MLYKYAIKNFQSFKERVEVDLTLSRKVTLTDWMVEREGEDYPRVSKVMAVLGPNGSGKTTLIKSLVFLHWFITNSFSLRPDSRIPFMPYAFSQEEPSEFECTFELNGKLFRYELTCTHERVLHEALYQQHERFRYVFERDWNESTKKYTLKQQHFGLDQQGVEKLRPNVSCIAWSAQYNVQTAVEISKLFILSNINMFGREVTAWPVVMMAAEYYSENPAQRDKMAKLLTSWGLGLSDVKIVEVKEFSAIPEEIPVERKKKWVPLGMHRSRKGEFALPFENESSFIQTIFVLLSKLLSVLEVGGVAVIDEIEADLHPNLLESILGLFADESTNPHHAQLLFTCHSIEVLNLINKAQVILTEKNEFCESQAYRLDTVEGIRNDDNLYAKYLAGAYGAVPNI